MKTYRVLGLALMAAVMIAAAHAATTKQVLLRVDGVPLAWSESRIGDRLSAVLSRSGSLQVRQIADDHEPAFPGDLCDLDRLVDWGLEIGGRYLLLVDIDHEGLERRKSWLLPLIFHRWETVGVIEGKFRLIDLSRGRQVQAEPFRVEQKAKGAFQASMDDDVHDPDIHLTAPEKVRFFDSLEQKLCDELVERIDVFAALL